MLDNNLCIGIPTFLLQVTIWLEIVLFFNPHSIIDDKLVGSGNPKQVSDWKSLKSCHDVL